MKLRQNYKDINLSIWKEQCGFDFNDRNEQEELIFVDPEIAYIVNNIGNNYLFNVNANCLIISPEQIFLDYWLEYEFNKPYGIISQCFKTTKFNEANFFREAGYFKKVKTEPVIEEIFELAERTIECYCQNGLIRENFSIKANSVYGRVLEQDQKGNSDTLINIELFYQNLKLGSFSFRTFKDKMWIYGTAFSYNEFFKLSKITTEKSKESFEEITLKTEDGKLKNLIKLSKIAQSINLFVSQYNMTIHDLLGE